MLLRVGDVEIWRILESVDPFFTPEHWFPEADPAWLATVRAVPGQFNPVTGKMLLPVQGFLLRTPSATVLVDTCVGNHKSSIGLDFWAGRNDTRFLAALTAAGASPADIDFVMCTHLHLDHIGWNTRLEDGRWVPTFPNAKYLFPAADHAHYDADPNLPYQESVLPVIEAGQAEMVGPDHRLGDYISLIPTPGHTAGHVSVQIESGGARAVITGDAIHSTAQCHAPDQPFVYDDDGVASGVSRRALLAHAAEGGHMVLGTHFVLPSIGTVVADGDLFQWRPR